MEKVFLLNEYDREKIIRFENDDENNISAYFGKKNNIGVKQALRSDILVAFITNREYDWPKNNLQIVYDGQVIGKDISDADDINRLKSSNDICVFGNIAIDFHKFRKIKNRTEPPTMFISAKPCPKVKELPLVSEAMIASPSRRTDQYIKSKIDLKSDVHIGTFIVGINLKTTTVGERNSSPMMVM